MTNNGIMPERGFWNKCDFNRRRKTCIASDDWTSSGKEFQITDAATTETNDGQQTDCDIY